jgi:hypothetical protein
MTNVTIMPTEKRFATIEHITPTILYIAHTQDERKYRCKERKLLRYRSRLYEI